MTAEKFCLQCASTKPATSFAKWSRSKDGLQSECRECKAKRYLISREHTRAKQKENWVIYSSKNREELAEKNRLRRLTSKDKDAKYREAYKKSCAPKIAAKNAVWSNILTGKLAQESCCICGDKKADAHHDDYANMLNVRWLCRKHHSLWHSVYGEAPNGRAIEAHIRGEKK